jgi:primosomal protein N' (replication factor Y) (superfamily II helicase)
MPSFQYFAEVILDISCEKVLDYGIPADLVDTLKKGVRVNVLVRGYTRKGYVISVKSHTECKRVLPIKEILSPHELLSDEIFDLSIWMTKYYCCSIQKVLKAVIPSPIRKDMQPKKQLVIKRVKTKKELIEVCKKIRRTSPSQALAIEGVLQIKKDILLTELLEKTGVSRQVIHSLEEKGLISSEKLTIDRSPLLNHDFFPTKDKILNSHQKESYDSISQSLESNSFHTHLLYGVTGSGKTEVYLQSIQKALSMGKSCLILVPEIALTTQTVERFKSRIKEEIAILHHRLGDGERYDQWYKILKGEVRVVIGARSAIFSPLQNLGLIIVDEEHERSYKQCEDTPTYNARDIAVVRGKMTGSCVVLGSATPSMESFHNAKEKRYILNTLSERADSAAEAQVEIVDMKIEHQKNQGFTIFSQPLLKQIKENHLLGQQSILFLNRRGYFTLLLCTSCSHTIKCPNCDVSLTFHRGENILSCHQCNHFVSPPPKHCPACHEGSTMKFRGIGTEQIERSLKAIFPELRLLRMDADTTRHKGSHDKIIKAFKTHKADVLIGTQMIAKGLHFPHVTLACVLNCDSALNIPDFRSSEHTFQLLTQVAGRSGRGKLKGKAIFQSGLPNHPLIEVAAKQDFEAFYEEEIEIRKLFEYPPFSQMIKISFQGTDEKLVEQSANRFKSMLVQSLPARFHVHPVIPSGHAKIKGSFRFHCLIRGPSILVANKKIMEVIDSKVIPSSVRYLVDINPSSTFF